MSDQSSNPNLAIQSNDLVNASYKLTLTEKRLLLIMIAQINKGDKDFEEYDIPVWKFQKITGSSHKDVHTQLDEVTNTLLSRVVLIPLSHNCGIDEDEGWLKTSFVSSAKYLKKQKILRLKFDPELKPYLLEVRKRFTQLDIRYAIKLKSIYSIRIYELLKQYHVSGKKGCFAIFRLEDIKHLLQVQRTYKEYRNFKQKVLKVAERELRAKADIYFKLVEIKEGRKVVRIKLEIHDNDEILKTGQLDLFDNMSEVIESECEEVKPDILSSTKQEILEKLIDQGFSKRKAKELVQENELEFLTNIMNHVDGMRREGKIATSPAQLINHFIKEGTDPTAGKELDAQDREQAKQYEIEKKHSIQAKKQGKLIHIEFENYIYDKIDAVIADMEQEQIEEIFDSLNDNDKRLVKQGGKINPDSRLFRNKVGRMYGYSNSNEGFIKWADTSKGLKVQKYELDPKEHLRLGQHQVNQEGWEIVS